MKLKHFGVMAGIGLAMLLMGGPSALAQTLGTAESFAILAHETVTNTGLTIINGNLGVSPGNALTLGAGTVIGTIHLADAVAAQAQSDVTTAYNYYAGLPCGTGLTGQDLGGKVLAPGVYCFTSSAGLTGTLTLDAQNDPNAVFVFQIASALTTAPNSDMNLINGAANGSVKIFWQVGSSATLDTGTTFAGNILALASVTLKTGATLSGRALARTGAVTLDTNGVTASHPTPAPGCPDITLLPAPPLPQGTRLAAYNQTITASGGTGPYTFSVTAGALPAGLSLTSGGLISGTPTTAGTFTFTVTATDANVCTGLQAYTIVINVPACPTITLLQPPLPQGTRLAAYNQTITASGGTGPYTFSVTAGALPTGLSPLTSGGLISGTPTTAGTFTFTVTATDANACTGLQAYTIVINAPVCPTITFSPGTLPNGTVGTAYNQTVSAAPPGAYTFSVSSGALPNGLSLNASTGAITGTPTTAAPFGFTITATDANGCTGAKAYAVTIAPAVATIPTLSEWGLMMLAALLALYGVAVLRRRQTM